MPSKSKPARIGEEEHRLIMELAVRSGRTMVGAIALWPRCPRCGFLLSASPRDRHAVECLRCGAEYVLWYRP